MVHYDVPISFDPVHRSGWGTTQGERAIDDVHHHTPLTVSVSAMCVIPPPPKQRLS